MPGLDDLYRELVALEQEEEVPRRRGPSKEPPEQLEEEEPTEQESAAPKAKVEVVEEKLEKWEPTK